MEESVSIIKVATAFPLRKLSNDFFSEGLSQSPNNKMFMGTKWRHHLEKERTAADLISEAVHKMQLDPKKIDMILTNVSLPDEPFLGCGASVAKKAGFSPKWVFDLHNGGCVSFLLMLDLAKQFMVTNQLQGAIICCVQTAAGRIFSHPENLKRPQSAVPGDGCGVVYIERGNKGLVLKELVQHCYPEYADDMFSSRDGGLKWWEPGISAAYIDFNEEKVAKVLIRGNRLVPQIVREVCGKVGMKAEQLDLLITNQPNAFFLRNWREALLLPPEKHLDTFEEYANLFGAAFPINLEKAILAERIRPGQKLCMAGFSHAGDYAGGAIFEQSA